MVQLNRMDGTDVSPRNTFSGVATRGQGDRVPPLTAKKLPQSGKRGNWEK